MSNSPKHKRFDNQNPSKSLATGRMTDISLQLFHSPHQQVDAFNLQAEQRNGGVTCFAVCLVNRTHL